MRGFSLALSVLLLGGCATMNEPVLNAAPVDISDEELDRYWVVRESTVNVRPPESMTDCGVVNLRFLIDSDGEVHDIEVLGALPERIFDQAAIDARKGLPFEPAASNPNRTPVRVTQNVTFDANPNNGVDCSELADELLSSRPG